MAEFLTTNGTSNCIEQIILKATKKLVLVTPYLQISKTFTERLMDASNRGVNIKIIYGKSQLEPKQKDQLAKLDNLELYFFENLHAKCYFNEKNMVITSMNMYEFSEKNNREMGIAIDRVNDTKIFEDAMNETLSILKSAKKEDIQKEKAKFKEKAETKANNISMLDIPPKRSTRLNNTFSSYNAYCIRCGDPVKKNSNKPFCKECFEKWDTFGNYDYEEKYCHTCGDKTDDISMRKPLCYTCFTKGKW